jgi:hypothetical protein
MVDKGGWSPRKFEVGGMEVVISPPIFQQELQYQCKFSASVNDSNN